MAVLYVLISWDHIVAPGSGFQTQWAQEPHSEMVVRAVGVGGSKTHA